MSEREKKIAEIRKSAEEARKTDRSWVDGQDYADDVEFLLDELDRIEREYAEERAAHNAHVTELCELEKKYAAFLEQWEVYQREREKVLEEIQTGPEKLCELEEENRKLREEREKLIEGLRFYIDYTEVRQGELAREILDEIGVTVE